ncbi:MAG: hypothetical protein EA360_10920 [Balneolaceae bacterium]|nr:MAG: hypothetical protein EA360_10920 [Balneolaceae bacterium]
MKLTAETYRPLLFAAVLLLAQFLSVAHYHEDHHDCSITAFEEVHEDNCILCDVTVSFLNTSSTDQTTGTLTTGNVILPFCQFLNSEISDCGLGRAPPFFS